MRIQFFSKRFPQGRDLLLRPYGRFVHLPVELARLGHEVKLTLLSHRGLPAAELARDGVRIESIDIRNPATGWQAITASLDGWKPDWLVGCSDAWVGVLAGIAARRGNVKLALDAYDDFESYMPWNLPLHWAWRGALRRADLVTAAGPQLAELLGQHRPSDARPVAVIPMAADPGFVPLDKDTARQALALPAQAPLIGYLGSWSGSRGSQLILNGFRRLHESVPDARLVLTGNPPRHALSEPGAISLGYIADELLPAAINAVDACAVVTADTRFGRSSYPAKLCEAMACGVPVIATDTPPVRWMLATRKEMLVPLGDPDAFATAALAALKVGRVEYPAGTWQDSARRYSELINS